MHTVAQLLEHKGHDVVTVQPDDTTLKAARLMNERHIGAVVVTEGDKVLGIFTERDMLCRVVAEQKSPAETTIGKVMTSRIIVAAPETTLDEARATMREKRVRHLPVLEDGRLRGILSIGDLNFAQEQTQEETIRYLEQYMYRP